MKKFNDGGYSPGKMAIIINSRFPQTIGSIVKLVLKMPINKTVIHQGNIFEVDTNEAVWLVESVDGNNLPNADTKGLLFNKISCGMRLERYLMIIEDPDLRDEGLDAALNKDEVLESV